MFIILNGKNLSIILPWSPAKKDCPTDTRVNTSSYQVKREKKRTIVSQNRFIHRASKYKQACRLIDYWQYLRMISLSSSHSDINSVSHKLISRVIVYSQQSDIKHGTRLCGLKSVAGTPSSLGSVLKSTKWDSHLKLQISIQNTLQSHP